MSKRATSIKTLLSWSLYDWAHSAFSTIITTFIFSSYFTQAIAPNPIEGTELWGHAIAISGLIIALLSPFLGAIADRHGMRKPWIFFFTVLTALSASLLWFSKPSEDYIVWTLMWVIVGSIGFEMAYVFYNAMMHGLIKKQYLGRLSGWAWGSGYAGGIVALLVALMLIQKGGDWFNLQTHAAQAIRLCGPMVGVWLLLFSLPLFINVPDQSKKEIDIKTAIREGSSSFIANIKKLRGYQHVGIFLLARMLFIDGLNTLFAFGGIYAAGEFHFSPADIVKFGIAMNVSAGVGAVIFAWLDDYFGSKKIMLFCLMCLIIGVSAILLVKSLSLFWIFALFISLFVGPVQAASRTYMVHITPEARMSEFFGLFALSGKITSFMGPWLVAILTSLFESQRVGMSSILVFLILGIVILFFIKDPRRLDKSLSMHDLTLNHWDKHSL